MDSEIEKRFERIDARILNLWDRKVDKENCDVMTKLVVARIKLWVVIGAGSLAVMALIQAFHFFGRG